MSEQKWPVMSEKHASWFTYGRYEGSHGGYMPPDGVVPRLLYWIGNMVGRRFGPSRLYP